jgi:hypothetical protein
LVWVGQRVGQAALGVNRESEQTVARIDYHMPQAETNAIEEEAGLVSINRMRP